MDLYTGISASRPVETLHAVSLRQVCQEFESVFIAYLLKNMRRTVSGIESANDGFSAGFSKDIYLSMMDEEVARAAARGPGIGLAEALYRQISQSKNI